MMPRWRAPPHIVSATMYKSLLSVGGFTLLSRATGFVRDIALSTIVGGGLIADAFFVAFRLPNHFRAIFGRIPIG